MSRLRLRLKSTTILGGGGGSTAATYDSRYGTAVDANGWFTFGLRSGCRRVYVNGGAADDTGNGLTPATAKKTLSAGLSVWTTGFTAGDQLMLAEGFTYTDPGTTTLANLGGFSATYQTAILSYDPADSANTAKFGRALGTAKPVITVPTSGNVLVSHLIDNAQYYLAVQGVEFNNPTNAAGIQLNMFYRLDGTVFQNCRFNRVALALNNASSAQGNTQGCNVSKCSFWGAWATGGSTSNFYIEKTDALYLEDCVFVRGGWKIGASRTDTTANGGPSTSGLGHAFYYYSTCTNGVIQRIVGIDSAQDSLNIRGGATANDLVSWDDPIAGYFTQVSSSYTEAPSGRVVAVTDCLVMGGDHIDDGTSAPRGQGLWFRNPAAGTGVDNLLMIDNPKYGTVNNQAFIVDNRNDQGLTGASVSLNRVTTWNYAATLLSNTSTNTTAVTFNNSITDTLPSGGSNNSTWTTGTFPSAKTRDQVISALLTAATVTPGASYTARKAQVVNLMLHRPDLDWARYLISIAFPAFNKTTTRALASPPSLASVTPPAVY